MSSASGAFTEVRIKKETDFGVFAGASGAQELRRTTCDVDMDADKITSKEIRTDQQVAVSRLGMRKVAGNLNGELSPGSYAPYIASCFRKDLVDGATITGTTIAASHTAPHITDSGNGFLTAGFKLGGVVSPDGFSHSGNNGNRFIVTALTAGAMTLANLDGTPPTFTDEAATASVTIAEVGKKTWIPTTGHTRDSYSIERFFSDIGKSRAYLGCRFSSLDVNLSPTDFATVALGVMGQSMVKDDAAQFTSPTAASTSQGLAGVSGVLMVDGVAVGLVTGGQFKVDGQMQTQAVIGTPYTPDIWPGTFAVSGQLTAVFEDETFGDAFTDETDVSVLFVLTDGPELDADFVTFGMTRITIDSAKVDDKQSGALIQTLPFTALINTAGGTGVNTEKTTIWMQDSLA
jgi:Phage tail tube protein